MKAKTHLLDEFVKVLRERVPSRPELVREIARILDIENEPASRRLNRRVSFTVDEVGRLARELNISLDAVMDPEGEYVHAGSYILEVPWREKSLDYLGDILDHFMENTARINHQPAEFGYVFESMPIEFFILYPRLMKLYLFKWGHTFINSEEFDDFGSWEIPERFHRFRDGVSGHFNKPRSGVYIWDDALVWILVREIRYLHHMRVIDGESKELIRRDLHDLLSGLEGYIKNNGDESGSDIRFYTANIHIGLSCLYYTSEVGCFYYFHTNFSRTAFNETPETCANVRRWIDSFRKISSLISGTNQKERRLFFQEQHQIVDMLL